MKILIYGAGVIGSIFAGRLASSGQDVTLLARGKRLEELRQNGVVLSVPGKNVTERIPVKVIDLLAPEDIYDYILVVMQRTQVGNVLSTLSQNHTPNIVFVVNTASGYEEWARAIGRKRLMLGFPSAGGKRVGGEVQYFIGKGIIRMFQTTTFGEYDGQRSMRVRLLIDVFCRAGIPSVFCADMDAWQKTHVAMVTSIANALYEYDCDNYRLARSAGSVRLMVYGIREGFTALEKLGIQTQPAKLWYFRLPVLMTAAVFRAVMGTRLAETAMAKHCLAAMPEMLCLQEEFDALIKRSGVQTPSINRLGGYLLSAAEKSDRS